MAEIKKKLAEIYAGAEYKLAFIIVSKRINTRIFLDRGRTGENPRPGTVIDDVVTLPERYVEYSWESIDKKADDSVSICCAASSHHFLTLVPTQW